MMSKSRDPPSAPLVHEEQRGQESDSECDNENNFLVLERHKRKIAEAAVKLRQTSSDSEDDNDVRLVKKRQKLQDEKEDPRKSEDKFGSSVPENELDGAHSNGHKKNIVSEKEVEHSHFEDCTIDSNGGDEQGNVIKPSRAKYMPKRKKLQDDISSSDSDCKQQTKKIHVLDENSVETSPSKQSMQIQGKSSIKSYKKSKPKRQVSKSETEDENSSNISENAIESNEDSKLSFNEYELIKEKNNAKNSTGSSEEERNKKMEPPKKETSHEQSSNSDSENKELQTTTEAPLLDKSLNNSKGEIKKKQQEIVTSAENRKGENCDSVSDEEKPLKIVSKKTAKRQRDSSSDSGREDNKEKQENVMREVKGEREISSDSDEKPLKAVLKKPAKEGDISVDSSKIGNIIKQQILKTNLDSRREKESDSESDSEDEKPLKTVSKRTTEQGTSSCDSDLEHKGKSKVEDKNREDSDSKSDSEEEKPLKTRIKQQGSLRTSGREGGKRKQLKAKSKVQARRRKNSVTESDSEEDNLFKTVSSKAVRQRDSANDTNRGGRKRPNKPVKKVRSRKERGCDTDSEEETSAQESESNLKNSELSTSKQKCQKQETTCSSDSDDDESLKTSEKEKTQIKQSQKREKGKRTSRNNSDSDMQNEKSSRNSREDAHTNSDSSVYSEDKSKETSETKKSLHSMSSSESEDCSAGPKTKKREVIKKTSKEKKESKSSNSSSDSPVSDDERSKDKKEEKKDVPENKRITALKRYLRLAGIHIVHYSKVLQNCRSNKAKIEALLNLLRKEGLKGNPTIQKCKRLRKKIETRREVQELDVSNIMEEKGRPHRSSRCSYTKNYNEDLKHDAEEKTALIKERFSRIRDIIDSDSD